MDTKTERRLKVFFAHGFIENGETDTQIFGRCPFTGKDDKFYINKETLLWDSKTAGLSGNVAGFLKHIAHHYEHQITSAHLRTLAKNRQLSEAAFQGWGIGWTGYEFAIPVVAPSATVVDVRRWKPGGRILGTAGCEVGLLGSVKFAGHAVSPIFVCEGEWDTIALEWLRRTAGKDGIVVGMPGAGTFKTEWTQWFTDRDVYTFYDHDEPGREGEHLLRKRLAGVARSIRSCHWPVDLPAGFDTRDWIIAAAARIKEDGPAAVWDALLRLCKKETRENSEKHRQDDTGHSNGISQSTPLVNDERQSAWTHTHATLDDVFTVYSKWLYLKDTLAITVMLATVISQTIDGDPIWMFLVGPPGSAKTETLNGLSLMEQVYMTSSLTSHSLISGANWKDNVDPSLIPRLNGKVMVIKDFTSILSMRDTEKDEIFGILRDAYDGRCGKEFGNGVVRNYESRFTLMAAVTPAIYALSSSHVALGERFLKFAVSDNLIHPHEDDIINRAIDNIDSESAMRFEIADVCNSFVTHTVGLRQRTKETLPAMPKPIREQIVALARFGARVRGSVTRDAYRNDIMTSRPSAEIGSRLGKQLAKLSQAIALIHSHPVVTMFELGLVKKIVIDTLPQRVEDVVHALVQLCPTAIHQTTAQQVSIITHYPVPTVSRILQDLTSLQVVSKKDQGSGRYGWGVSDYLRGLIGTAKLYEATVPRRLTIRRLRR